MEDQARDVFSRLAELPGPPVGFTAEGLAARGRRQLRARRAGAALGTVGAVGAVAVAVAVLPGRLAQGSGAVAPGSVTAPGWASASTAAPSGEDASCDADVAEAVPASETENQPMAVLARQACPLLKRMTAVLDPDRGHLRAAGSSPPQVTDVINGYSDIGRDSTLYYESVTAAERYYPSTQTGVEYGLGPYMTVEISVDAPGAADRYPRAYDHGLPQADPKSGSPWTGAQVVATLADGSKVSVRRETDAGRTTYAIARTLTSGLRLTLYVDGPWPGAAGDTMADPFTEQQLIAAVSVPWTEHIGVRMPPGN